MDELIARQIGERIALLRTQLGMSLGDLATAAGLAKSYLSNQGEEFEPVLTPTHTFFWSQS